MIFPEEALSECYDLVVKYRHEHKLCLTKLKEPAAGYSNTNKTVNPNLWVYLDDFIRMATGYIYFQIQEYTN